MKTRFALSMTVWLASAMWIAAAASQSPGRTESFWRKVLRIAGVTVNPSNLRGPRESRSGTVWMVDTRRHTLSSVTTGGGYRSPVFELGNQSLLALQGDDLVRIPLAGGSPRKLLSIDGALKIVGLSRDSPDDVLILTRGQGDASVAVGLLSLKSGQATRLEYNPKSDDLRLVNHLAAWDRDYGDVRLSVRRQRKATPRGVVERARIIMIKPPSPEHVDLTPDERVDCLQPSLSWDHYRVAFIKAEDR
jgi:hypothetical protein